MIILDTNVISEPMRPRPDSQVIAWLDAQPEAELWLTALTVAELQLGIEMLDRGARRKALTVRIEETLDDFEDRILPFGEDAAFVYGSLVGRLRAAGIRSEIFDCQIASIALLHGSTIATRNIKDFANTGVPMINPWDA